jgi:hypothetical protein
LGAINAADLKFRNIRNKLLTEKMRGGFFLYLDRNGFTTVFQQGANEILADAMEFNANLAVRGFGSALVEVEDQGAASELKRVALFDGFK